MGNLVSRLCGRPKTIDKPSTKSKQLSGEKSAKLETYEPAGAEAYELVDPFPPDKVMQIIGCYEQVEDLGANGETHSKLMRNKKTKEIVSVKFVTKTAREAIPRGVEREIVNHRRLVHPNIVRFYEVFVADDNLGVVSEYPSGGCLADKIAAEGPVTEGQAKSLFLQLLSGMQYCHDTRIYHRDLRVQNMFLDETADGAPRLKISDFSYSKSVIYDSNPKTKVITAPLNTPPELLKGTSNQQAAYDGSKVDIWGAGIILYVILTGTQPFQDPMHPGVMNRTAMQKIVNCSFSFPIDYPLSRECKDFISQIFVADPNDRMSVADMHQHSWLSGTKASLSTGRRIESKQSENDIESIVERARKRRESRQAEQSRMRNSGDLAARIAQQKSVPGRRPTRHTSANKRPYEHGIAEIDPRNIASY